MDNYKKQITTRFKPFEMNDVPSQAFKNVDRRNPTIIQIGSHDGIIGEDYGFTEFISELDSFNLFLIEPIYKYFDKLKNIYSRYEGENKIINYCNFAITNCSNEVNMIDLGGCSQIVEYNTGLKVKSKSWDDFINENSINKIDFLLLDCEGYEFEILKTINYNENSPDVIRYEYFHIPNKIETDEFLIKKGYNVFLCETDPIYNKIAIKATF